MKIPATINEQIEQVKNSELSYRNLHPGATITITDKKSINIPFSSIQSKYKQLLDPIIVTKNLTNDDFDKYKYNPKKLSFDLYGTVEFWDTILIVNDCISVKDFNKQTVKYYNPAKFKSYLNEIIILEEEMGNIKI